MIFLSILSFLASALYFYVGYRAIKANRKSELCRTFFLLTLSMTIWAFAGGFIYLAEDAFEYSFWNKISAFGWCTFEAFALYFVMVLTENKYIRNLYFKIIVLLPAPIFLFMALFLFGPAIKTNPIIERIFYTGNFLYNFSYLAISIVLITLWGYKSNSRIQKKQAGIIAVCCVIPFLLNLLFQVILPYLGIITLPNMGQIFTLIMLWGVNYATIKYQFMSIPSGVIINELFNELAGLTFLTDSKGFIIKTNKQAYSLLNYETDELLGIHITDIIKDGSICTVFENCEDVSSPLKFYDINISSKSGITIPFNITVTPLSSRASLIGGLLVIGEDIRITKHLQEEIVNHKQTNEKLGNSESLFRKLLDITPVSIFIVDRKTKCIKYLNSYAVELLQEDHSILIGKNVSQFFVNTYSLDYLTETISKNQSISNNEVLFKRHNGSQFTGLITTVQSVYNGEQVTLSCIVDMTEQKRIEKTLTHNNENISKLNEELIQMNNILINKTIRDSLTNLYNHQFINELLHNKLQGMSETNEDLCVMMMDIDHFKRVNDKFGHQTGDKVLVAIADLISKNTRSDDYIGRYGGEEFIAVLPGLGIKDAVHIAERIRLSIQEHDFGIPDLNVTISIGVAQYNNEIPDSLINMADMLLYQAKSNGRNRVETILQEGAVQEKSMLNLRMGSS